MWGSALLPAARQAARQAKWEEVWASVPQRSWVSWEGKGASLRVLSCSVAEATQGRGHRGHGHQRTYTFAQGMGENRSVQSTQRPVCGPGLAWKGANTATTGNMFQGNLPGSRALLWQVHKQEIQRTLDPLWVQEEMGSENCIEQGAELKEAKCENLGTDAGTVRRLFK